MATSFRNIKALERDMANNSIFEINGPGAPVDGTTGAGFTGPGSIYVRTSNGARYNNAGTKAAPAWKLITQAA